MKEGYMRPSIVSDEYTEIDVAIPVAEPIPKPLPLPLLKKLLGASSMKKMSSLQEAIT
ncbi:hypothetical protein [Selenomonas sp. KH1T6]|uniref:hypothetical protein n=1 Tax=Selenomonas sp. KH1T6 TaxID=3158784 RepID=UPI001587B932